MSERETVREMRDRDREIERKRGRVFLKKSGTSKSLKYNFSRMRESRKDSNTISREIDNLEKFKVSTITLEIDNLEKFKIQISREIGNLEKFEIQFVEKTGISKSIKNNFARFGISKL